jgi:hypothetical protein
MLMYTPVYVWQRALVLLSSSRLHQQRYSASLSIRRTGGPPSLAGVPDESRPGRVALTISLCRLSRERTAGSDSFPCHRGRVSRWSLTGENSSDLRAGAICRRDANACSALWHKQIVAFPPFSPFALEGRLRCGKRPRRAPPTENITFSPINPQCRVIGSAGIVWDTRR